MSGEDILPPGRYRVRLDPDGADAIDVTLFVAPAAGPTPADLPRAPGRDGRRAALRDVTCDGAPVALGADGVALPAGCRALRYRVALDRIGEDGYDPTTRRAATDAARTRVVLPGAAIFVVPSTMQERPTLDLRAPTGMPVHHALGPSTDATGLALPAPAELAGVWLALGAFREEVVSTGGTRLRQLVDDDRALGALAPALSLAYLTRVTGRAPPPEVLVLAFGRRGGAPIRSVAGASVIATGFHADDGSERDAAARHAPALALLSGWLRILAATRLPDWLATSLAAYYAIRALEEGGAAPAEDLRALLAAIPSAAPGLRLLEAQSRLDRYGDVEAEAHFAAVGPGLWAALDRELEAASRGARSLDAVVPALLDVVYRPDGAPPARFTAVLVEAGAANAPALVEAWVGAR